jgi:outer membrane protein TolC
MVALADAERNAEEAERLRAMARSALASVVNAPGGEALPADSMQYRVAPLDLDELRARVRDSFPALRSLRAAARASRQKVAAKRADFFPTVFGYGMVNLFDHYMVDKLEPKWAVGVGARLTVFDGFRRSNEYQQASAEADAVDAALREAERKADLYVRNTLLAVQLAEQRYQRLDAALALAGEQCRLNDKRYETGLGTSLEAVDAQVHLEALQLQRLAALRDFYLGILGLCQSSGDAEAFLRFW